MIIDLPFPNEVLWPNGPSNRFAKSRETKKHRGWACIATREVLGRDAGFVPSAILLVVHPKSRGPAPDKDNSIAACKAMLDGVADALGVNDRDFPAPTVEISLKREGRFVLVLSPPIDAFASVNGALPVDGVVGESGRRSATNTPTALTDNRLAQGGDNGSTII